jgi:hypothetical protein
MAKKVRKRLEEEEAAAFEFPVFDEVAFVTKEFEMMGAVLLAGGIAIVLGVIGWVLSVSGLSVWVPFGLGILGIVLSPYVIQRVRRRSSTYTKGDWAGLLAVEFFGWLALWFVLLNVSPGAI